MKVLDLVFAAATLAPLALPTMALAAEPAMSQAQQGWQKVDNKKVCMVTDMVFPRDQIPVQVGKKTYYGCCENCKATLGKDEKVRYAVDPVSGKQVDKATAVIGAGPDGSVAYFENDANLEKFIALRKKS
ncbi:TRASH domain-containing protein [Oligoflexus tunisiensis]|uniref:TRASH domain-containing protein n=1 Tax=Oligoflexus tunisiensis TaxID=708132 RepID=UPI001C401505|nr:TRASH domain-containing protein [Oligoflexus tunisiensis]